MWTLRDASIKVHLPGHFAFLLTWCVNREDGHGHLAFPFHGIKISLLQLITQDLCTDVHFNSFPTLFEFQMNY